MSTFVCKRMQPFRIVNNYKLSKPATITTITTASPSVPGTAIPHEYHECAKPKSKPAPLADKGWSIKYWPFQRATTGPVSTTADTMQPELLDEWVMVEDPFKRECDCEGCRASEEVDGWVVVEREEEEGSPPATPVKTRQEEGQGEEKGYDKVQSVVQGDVD